MPPLALLASVEVLETLAACGPSALAGGRTLPVLAVLAMLDWALTDAPEKPSPNDSG